MSRAEIKFVEDTCVRFKMDFTYYSGIIKEYLTDSDSQTIGVIISCTKTTTQQLITNIYPDIIINGIVKNYNDNIRSIIEQNTTEAEVIIPYTNEKKEGYITENGIVDGKKIYKLFAVLKREVKDTITLEQANCSERGGGRRLKRRTRRRSVRRSSHR
jgi:hypothetical protein